MSFKERKTYWSYSDYLQKSKAPGHPNCKLLKQAWSPGTPCCVPTSTKVNNDNIYCNPTLRTYDKCFNKAVEYFNNAQYSKSATILFALYQINKTDTGVLELIKTPDILQLLNLRGYCI